jgi:formylglycine-generating enzyme required for sulfatase activity
MNASRRPLSLFALLLAVGCPAPADPSKTTPPTDTADPADPGDGIDGPTDADADGVPAEADCDDGDPALGAIAEDADCDAVLTADDCDDADPTLGAVSADNDCDGTLTADDCDDSDALSTTIAQDADCDGVLTAADCDDADPASTTRGGDADCDGVLSAADCDDDDAGLGAVALDGDCDGAITSLDCDDADAASTTLLIDADCDTVLTADDCDDRDPDSTVVAEDADCDATVWTADCDDTDATEGSIADSARVVILGGQRFVSICAHRFEMGCTAGQSDCGLDESPVMPVTLTHAYYMKETEVTRGEFTALMGYNPSYFSTYDDTCPVEMTSWHEAAAYANAMSAAEGLSRCYTCTGSGTGVTCTASVDPYTCPGYRLPTEAEWEAAARCGEDTLYAGSDDIDDVAWHEGSIGSPRTLPVATKAPNACGLSDMSGNVNEWQHDWYGVAYTAMGVADPVGPSSGTSMVRRGGSWNAPASVARVARRGGSEPSYRSNTSGFRIARTIP